MSRPFVQINAFFSFAVMLLMVVAVVAGQGRDSLAAGSDEMEQHRPVQASDFVSHSLKIELRNSVLKVSQDVAAELKYFRGEDE